MAAPADRAESGPSALLGRSGFFWAVAVLALLVSIGFAATRNIWDDETYSLGVAVRPVAELWAHANASDVHPPLHFVPIHLMLAAAGTPRAAAVFGALCLYAGLGYFVWALLRGGGLRGPARGLFVAVALLHPQVLMWGNAIRWQPYWAGLALAVLAAGLSLHRDTESGPIERIGWPATAMVAVGVAASLYLNYLGFALLAALGVGWALRYPLSLGSLLQYGAVVAASLLLFLPQLGPMLNVHFASGSGQLGSPLNALLVGLPGILVGQALQPWHPIALLFGLTTLPFLYRLLVRLGQEVRARGGLVQTVIGENPAWVVLLVLYLAVFLGAIATGIAKKPRTFLFLAPIFAYLLAVGWQSTRARWLRIGAAVVVTLWLASGALNLMRGARTAKAGLNDRYDEVIEVVQEESAGRSVLVLTTDPALGFALHAFARTSGERWVACSAAEDDFHGTPCRALLESREPIDDIVLVEGYIGSFYKHRDRLAEAHAAVIDAMDVRRRAKVGFDPDATMKRRLPVLMAKLSPDHRFTLYVGEPRGWANARDLAEGFRNVRRRPRKAAPAG